MNFKNTFFFAIAFIILAFTLKGCRPKENKTHPSRFHYEKFRDSVANENKKTAPDSTNLFDSRLFTPGKDSVGNLLAKIDSQWHHDAAMMDQMDSLIKRLKNQDELPPADKEKIKENIRILDSFLNHQDTAYSVFHITCKEKECPLYAAISKSKQILYLYIEGELKDSFKVSTGVKKFTTPDMNRKPSGPVFTRYTSHKFPGGNYMGLGNMPYAVFISGGYAIHGTTPGNFSKLGTIASHGCIRMHPDNARVFYELVKLFSLSNTWVTVRDTL